MKKILVKESISLILSLCMMLGFVLASGMDIYAASIESEENMTDSALSISEEDLETFNMDSGDATLEDEIMEDEAVEDEAVEDKTVEDEVMEGVMPLSAERSANAYTTSSTGNFSNLVVFVDFADTSHDHLNVADYHNNCHINHPEKVFEFFDGSAEKPRGFRQYLYNVSYGALQVMNIFPQYDEAAGTFMPYRLKYNAEHYYSQNTDAEMIGEIIEQLNASGGVGKNLHLSKNENVVDNLTIVVACDEGNTNNHFYGHKSTYAGSQTVDGNLVRNYTLVTEGGVFMGVGESGLLIHEFLHTLGFQDLYVRAESVESGSPVGFWDIMATQSYRVQYPLAYFRSHYMNWFSIPEVTTSQKGYSLYAASATTAATKDRQAVILKTGYSDTEFFVLEYRKQGRVGSEEYDSAIPGSGLIIYRVNTNAHRNIDGPPWQAYVFRVGDTYGLDGNGKKYEQASMDALYRSFLSAESNRTSFGTSDATKSLEDGAITYSDGTNSGIVIRNIGSAAGDQITFDIEFTDNSQDAYWTTVSTQNTQGASWIDSYMDTDGTMYYLQQRSGRVYLYRCQSSAWSQISNTALSESGAYGYRLVKYKDSLYVAYSNGSVARLVKWNGSSWDRVYTTGGGANELDVVSNADGIYLAYTDAKSSKLNVSKYTTSGATELGVVVQGSDYGVWNPSITVEDGKIVVLYREMLGGSKLYIKQYGNGFWNLVGGQGFTANNGMIKLHKGMVYLLKNGESFGVDDAYLYVCDLNSSSGSWTKVVDVAYANESITEMDICFHGDAPHIIYMGGKSQQVFVKNLGGAGWEQLGIKVTSEVVSGLKGYSYNGAIYLTYLTGSTNNIYIKSHGSQKTEGVTGGTTNPGGTTEGNTGSNIGGNTGGNTGSTTTPGGQKNGWVYENGQRYFYENGVKARSKEAFVDGYWRWFDADGTMAVSKDVYMANGDKWVRYDAYGRMIKGWHTTSNGKYYFDLTTGAMSKGVKKIDGKFYYFSQVTGILAEYRSEEVPLDGDWYWFDADGTVAVSKDVYQWSSGGKWVRYDANGRMVKGWDYTNQGKYYFDLVTGAMSKGIKNIDGKYYYFYEVTGVQAEFRGEEVPIDGYWRWFDADGTVAVSKDVYQWSSGGKWVRYDASGGMIKGWDHTFWGSYYFDLTTGAMAKGLCYIDGRWYYFDERTGILRW